MGSLVRELDRSGRAGGRARAGGGGLASGSGGAISGRISSRPRDMPCFGNPMAPREKSTTPRCWTKTSIRPVRSRHDPCSTRSLFRPRMPPAAGRRRAGGGPATFRRRLSPRGRSRDLPLPAHGPGQPAPVGAATSGKNPYRTHSPQQGAGSRRRTRKRLDRLSHLPRPSLRIPLEILQQPIAGEGVEFQIEFAVLPDHIQRRWIDFTCAQPVRAHVLS